MIDRSRSRPCKACGKPVVQGPGGHRRREYCNDACKMRYRRSQHPTQQQQTITALQEQLTEASAHIAKLETDNYSLRTFIDQLRDIEEAFRTDTRVHPLKKFLASSPYHAVRPGCVKILDPEAGIAPRGSRGTYTDIMRRAGFSADEQADVWAAWADMLKEELIKHYYTGKQS